MITFQEWIERRELIHKERMLETTRRDLELSKHPYEEFIPHIMIHWGMRQHVDMYELNF